MLSSNQHQDFIRSGLIPSYLQTTMLYVFLLSYVSHMPHCLILLDLTIQKKYFGRCKMYDALY
jgi:hypothetical protein